MSTCPAAEIRATEGIALHSCSTFMLSAGDAHYVGHNMDDYYPVPGMVLVNRRGVAKESISWQSLDPRCQADAGAPKVHWVSRFGSLTCNTLGREFIDGGVNEAGLCVNEMTLMGTAWPVDDRPQIYHHQWMQYLLDNFDTVDDVLDSLRSLSISGHCQWHFFVADRTGSTAVIEFLEGARTVYRGGSMPFRVLCNTAYGLELENIRRFRGYGGEQPLGMDNKAVDNRFVWAAALIDGYPESRCIDPVAYCFDILRELDCGPTQWSLVYDLTAARMYFRTAQAGSGRFVDVASFDLSCAVQAVALDINRDLESDVSSAFEPYTDADNEAFVRKALEPIDTSSLDEGFKPALCRNLLESTRGFG